MEKQEKLRVGVSVQSLPLSTAKRSHRVQMTEQISRGRADNKNTIDSLCVDISTMESHHASISNNVTWCILSMHRLSKLKRLSLWKRYLLEGFACTHSSFAEEEMFRTQLKIFCCFFQVQIFFFRSVSLGTSMHVHTPRARATQSSESKCGSLHDIWGMLTKPNKRDAWTY